MRLKKRECNEDAFFDEVFTAADDLALAMNAGDFPYVIPVNFVQNKTNGGASISSALPKGASSICCGQTAAWPSCCMPV